jgi:hypothetical protein
MPPSKNIQSKKSSQANEVECTICYKWWDVKGIGNHRRACEKKHLLALQQKEYEERVNAASNTARKFCFVLAQ